MNVQEIREALDNGTPALTLLEQEYPESRNCWEAIIENGHTAEETLEFLNRW